MARSPTHMYAEATVFKYQTFDQDDLNFSPTPVAPPPTSTARYYGVVTDLPPKSEAAAKETPADPETPESPAEPTPEPAVVSEG